jgi:hypothetical protein
VLLHWGCDGEFNQRTYGTPILSLMFLFSFSLFPFLRGWRVHYFLYFLDYLKQFIKRKQKSETTVLTYYFLTQGQLWSWKIVTHFFFFYYSHHILKTYFYVNLALTLLSQRLTETTATTFLTADTNISGVV